VACLIQDKLGIAERRCPAFDVNSVCAGFVFALDVAQSLLLANPNQFRNALVIGTDAFSKIMNWQDRRTCIFFGDGAGAVLLEPAEEGFGLLDFYHRVDGSGREELLMPAGGSYRPASHATVDGREHYLKQNGKVVFKFAVSQMAGCITTLLERHGLSPQEIAMVIPHQANQRILDATAERLGLPEGRMASVIGRYGNTTAATLPLALEDVVRAGRVTRGDLVVFVAVGAGFTVGATLVRWQ